jgi:hypothetical protein
LPKCELGLSPGFPPGFPPRVADAILVAVEQAATAPSRAAARVAPDRRAGWCTARPVQGVWTWARAGTAPEPFVLVQQQPEPALVAVLPAAVAGDRGAGRNQLARQRLDCDQPAGR